MPPKFTALLVIVLICAAGAASQNLVRSLAFEYRYSSFAGAPTEPTAKRNSFIFFYTPDLANQRLDIAVACRTVGWVASGLNSDPLGGMAGAGNIAVKGISSATVEQRDLNAQGISGTPLSATAIYTNASAVVDGPYVVLRFSRPFTFTATSNHTFLHSCRQDPAHGPHTYDYWPTRNIQVATGGGMTNPPLCSPANCNLTCVEPYVCAVGTPQPPPVAAPFDSSCNVDGFSKYADLSTSYRFGYTITGTTISVGVQVPDSARWAAWGIAKDSSLLMAEAEAVIARFDAPSVVRAYSTGVTRDSSRFAQITTDLALNDTLVCQGNGVKIFKFTRNLAGKSNPIATSGNVPILGVIGSSGAFDADSSGVPSASNRGHGTDAGTQLNRAQVDLASGGAAAASADPLRVAHGSLMFIGWGALLQFGAFWARYAKKLPKVGGVPVWFFIHRLFQPLGYLIAIIGFIIAIVFTQRAGSAHFASPHPGLGLATMILGLIQLVIAPFRPHAPNKDKGETEPTLIRKLWEYKHWYIGRAALILTVITIFLGIRAIGVSPSATTGLYAAYGAFVGFTVLMYIIFEIRRLMDPEKTRTCY